MISERIHLAAMVRSAMVVPLEGVSGEIKKKNICRLYGTRYDPQKDKTFESSSR